MKKRDIMVYDGTWQAVTQQLTEYDVDIITNIIVPKEITRLVILEQDFEKRYPNVKIKYNLIEADPNVPLQFSDSGAKLIYDSDTTSLNI